MAKQTAKEKQIADKNKALVDNALSAENDKEYATLQFAQYLHEIRDANAQASANFEPTPEGFKEFCDTYLRTGYQTAMRYIAIHNMRVRCAVDPAVAEDLGYSKLRAIAGVANPDNINLLLEQAKNLTTGELEQWVKAYKSGENPNGKSSSGDTLPLFKKYIISASEEEVPIISRAIEEVGALLNTKNITTIVVHIMQEYMVNLHSAAHTSKVEEIRKEGSAKKGKETTGTKQDKKAASETKPKASEEETKREEADTPPWAEGIISEEDIIKASLPELIAFAESRNITIDDKIKGNKTKVRSFLIDVVSSKATEAVKEDIPTDTSVNDIPPENAPATEAEAPKKGRKKSGEPAEKAPTKGKAKEKESIPEPEVPNPSDAMDAGAEVTLNDAIAEVRSAANKKTLKNIAESYGIKISDADYKAKDADTLIEDVVRSICEANDEPYIPPVDDDQIDNMLNGD